MRKNAEVVVNIEDAVKHIEKKASDRMRVQMQQSVVNPIELARACDVRPQMIYNYIKKGYISAVRENNTQKLYIELNEAIRFVMTRLNASTLKKIKATRELEATSS